MSAESRALRAGSASLGIPRIRSHLFNPRFWIVQSVVVGMTVVHGVVEYAESNGELSAFADGLHNLPVEGYVLPVVLAGWWFGLEGGLFTALLSMVLSVPNLLLFHRENMEWLGELGAVVFIISVGVLLAYMVESEAAARRELSEAHRQLEMLHTITSLLNRAGEPRAMTKEVLEKLCHVDGVVGAAFVPETRLPGDPGENHSTPITSGSVGSGFADAPRPGMVSAVVTIGSRQMGTLTLDCASEKLCRDHDNLLKHVAQELGFALGNLEMQERERDDVRAYARAITQAEERERRRIARDLHDGAAQSIVLLVRGLGRMMSSTMPPNENAAHAATLRKLARDALHSIRRTTWALRPALLDDLGLLPAIESLADRASERNAVAVDVIAEGGMRRLSPDVELAAFRIVAECLANIEHHAAASLVTIDIEFASDVLTVTVSDDGVGFDPTALGSRENFGLVGMVERAESAGGTLTIDTHPGGGTRVEFRVADAITLPVDSLGDPDETPRLGR
jgi:signal transduction histidine kinase